MSENEAEAADADDAESAAEGLQDGDFVELDYTLRTTDDDEVIDTTHESVAEEAGIADEDNRDFTPRTIIIGDGHVFESVDDSLRGSEVGDGDSVIVTPEEGFGEYDPEEVRTVSAEKIPEDDRYPGATVQIDRQQGHIETIIGGRARVNFNHPLAGEELEYDYEIAAVVDDREQQAEGILGMQLQEVPDLWIETDEVDEEVTVEADDEDAEPTTETQTVEKETLYIEATQQLTMNQQWMMGKTQIAQEITDKLGLDRVIVQEILDGGGMMGGMGGMMGGGMGGGDVEEALDDVDLDDVDLDADELAESLEE
jgi:FKBP-type peptidyl-prolyl cis-trans isomerase SlyD